MFRVNEGDRLAYSPFMDQKSKLSEFFKSAMLVKIDLSLYTLENEKFKHVVHVDFMINKT